MCCVPLRAVICFIIYFVLGFFGAARWGLNTNGNLLVNTWGPPAYQGILNILLGGTLLFCVCCDYVSHISAGAHHMQCLSLPWHA